MSEQPLSPPPIRTCPNCFATVPLGVPICPQCGAAQPPQPYPYPTLQPYPTPKKSNVGLIVAIVLIAIIVVGLGAYAAVVAYENNQAQILQASKTSDQADASKAPDQLQFTCFTTRNDSSHLSYSPYYGYSGYMIISETFGVSNPTRFIIAARWTLTLDYPAIGWNLESSAPFQVSANGLAHPTFAIQISASQFNSLPPNPDYARYTVTLDGTYSVTGTYDTYNVSRHATYDSSTRSGTGALASNNNLPAC